MKKNVALFLRNRYFLYICGEINDGFMGNIIGRRQEIQELNDLYNSNKAQMVAVYGRRRVGKTFLVDEALKGRITFRHAGLSPNNEDSGKKNMLKDQVPLQYCFLQAYEKRWTLIWCPNPLEVFPSLLLQHQSWQWHLPPLAE